MPLTVVDKTGSSKYPSSIYRSFAVLVLMHFLNSINVCTLAVPVPSLEKGGGQR